MEKMNFYETQVGAIKQSGFYPVSKSEVIEYFRNFQPRDLNPFELIENHGKIEFMLPGDRGTIFRFFPVGDGDYQFQMTISVNNMPPLDERLIQMIEGKNPIEPTDGMAFINGPGN